MSGRSGDREVRHVNGTVSWSDRLGPKGCRKRRDGIVKANAVRRGNEALKTVTRMRGGYRQGNMAEEREHVRLVAQRTGQLQHGD